MARDSGKYSWSNFGNKGFKMNYFEHVVSTKGTTPNEQSNWSMFFGSVLITFGAIYVAKKVLK